MYGSTKEINPEDLHGGHYELDLGGGSRTATNFELNISRSALASAKSAGRHFLSRPPTVAAAGNSIITHLQQFVKRKVAQILSNYFSRICATLPVDFWCGLWYTIGVKRAEMGYCLEGVWWMPFPLMKRLSWSDKTGHCPQRWRIKNFQLL